MNKGEIKNYLNILRYSTIGKSEKQDLLLKNAEFFFERLMYAAEKAFGKLDFKMLYKFNSNWNVPTISFNPVIPSKKENKGGCEVLVHMWGTWENDGHIYDHLAPEILFSELNPNGDTVGYGYWVCRATVDEDGYHVDDIPMTLRELKRQKEVVLADNWTKIKYFVKLMRSSINDISKTIAWVHSVCPEPEEYEYICYRRWLEETTVKIISDIDIKLRDTLRHRLKRVFNNDPKNSDEETDLINYEIEIGDRLFHFYLGTDLRDSMHDEYDSEPYVQINIGIEELTYDEIWDIYESTVLTMANYFINRDEKVRFTPWEKSNDCELSDVEINKLFGKVLKAIGPLNL